MFQTGLGVIAVDVGGTTIKGAVVGPGQEVVDEMVVATHNGERSPEEALLALIGTMRSSALRAGLPIAGIGLAVAGIIDEKHGTIIRSANLHWNGLALRDLVVERNDGLSTTLVNDARAAALAEHRWGAVVDVPDFVIVPIGTGVGGAVMSAGHLLSGATEAAGEFGHVVAFPGGDRCTCGNQGCVEAYASGPALTRRYFAVSGRSMTAAELALLAEEDPIAAGVWRDAGNALAVALAGAVAATDPAVVVLAGGVARAGDVLVRATRDGLGSRLGERRSPRVIVNGLGVHAARMGAALVATGGFEDQISNPAPVG